MQPRSIAKHRAITGVRVCILWNKVMCHNVYLEDNTQIIDHHIMLDTVEPGSQKLNVNILITFDISLHHFADIVTLKQESATVFLTLTSSIRHLSLEIYTKKCYSMSTGKQHLLRFSVQFSILHSV